MFMPFGKYRGFPVDELPEAYLTWLWREVDLREPLLSAVQEALFPECGGPVDAVMPDRDLVRTVYRRLAMKYHPDRTGGDHTPMAAINEFYEALGGRQ